MAVTSRRADQRQSSAVADGVSGDSDVDLLVGADGIHSTVRAALFGPDEPEFTGVVAYRSVIPAHRLRDLPDTDAFTKWWGPDS